MSHSNLMLHVIAKHLRNELGKVILIMEKKETTNVYAYEKAMALMEAIIFSDQVHEKVDSDVS